MKKVLLGVIISLLLSSCAFIFYNYKGVLDTDFSITNDTRDTVVRYRVGKLIYRLSKRQDFYTRYTSRTCDSLYFYGPDYHWFRCRIFEDGKTTTVRIHYFGYHGFRSHPPLKKFIQAVTDSLKTNFSATQTIIKDISNERKRK